MDGLFTVEQALQLCDPLASQLVRTGDRSLQGTQKPVDLFERFALRFPRLRQPDLLQMLIRLGQCRANRPGRDHRHKTCHRLCRRFAGVQTPIGFLSPVGESPARRRLVGHHALQEPAIWLVEILRALAEAASTQHSGGAPGC